MSVFLIPKSLFSWNLDNLGCVLQLPEDVSIIRYIETGLSKGQVEIFAFIWWYDKMLVRANNIGWAKEDLWWSLLRLVSEVRKPPAIARMMAPEILVLYVCWPSNLSIYQSINLSGCSYQIINCIKMCTEHSRLVVTGLYIP